MKVLHVVPSMRRSEGGPSECVPMTAITQAKAGLDVAIAFHDVGELSERAREAELAGVRLVKFTGRHSFWNPTAFSWDFCRQLEDVAREYDVVHTHAQWMFPIWWAAYVARKLGKKLVMMPHGSFEPERLRRSAWKKKLVGWIDRHFANCADAVWATADVEADGIKMFAQTAKVEVFPIGINVEEYAVSKQSGQTLLYMSRISPIKGLDMLAEAWRRVSAENGDWKLVIAGPDDRGYTEVIKKVFATKCRQGSYEFKGPVYGSEKFRLLAGVDAFILPTKNENWGIVVAEAMASGLPVICTRGAPWNCLESERAGWWTQISAEGICSALCELMQTTSDERRKMGARGRQWVVENLDWNAVGVKMRASYETMLNSSAEQRSSRHVAIQDGSYCRCRRA